MHFICTPMWTKFYSCKKWVLHKTTNNVSYSHANASHVSHMSYHDFDASYVLMRNKIGKIVVLHVGPHHKRSKACVWVAKCLVTNLRGPNQSWVHKIKA
jgi:hypothetical protein